MVRRGARSDVSEEKQARASHPRARTYIENNGRLIPNYGERWCHREAISTAFVESSVNAVVNKRFRKKQQVQWSKRGAHLLMQTRTRVLNGELRSLFRQWYPNLSVAQQQEQEAA